MKNYNGQRFNNMYNLSKDKYHSNKLQKNENYSRFNSATSNQNLFNQNKVINNPNQIYNLYYKNNNIQIDKMNKPVIPPDIIMAHNFSPKKRFNYMKNLNPSHMRYNNGVNGSIGPKKKVFQNNFKNKENIYYMRMDNQNDNNFNTKSYASIPKKSNNNSINNDEYPKKKMGYSQNNFYNKNNVNYFPNINTKKQAKNNLNENYEHYSYAQFHLYKDLINNMVKNNPEIIKNENFIHIFDFDYKRPEEKLRKGQNELILERLQKKYITQLKEQKMLRTGTGFYPKKKNNNITKKRQFSAQENSNDTIKVMLNVNNKIENNKDNKDMNNKNNIDNNNNINKEKIIIDEKQNKEKTFNKTYNNGFNIKKHNKEKRKKEKKIFTKIFQLFNKKSNYFWIRFFNKKRRMKYENEEENTKKNKSFDNNQLLSYPKLIKRCLHTKIINNKRNYNNKNNLKYNTDNSEIDEIKEYKKYQKKIKNEKSDYANFIKPKNYNEEDKNESSSDSDNSNIDKKEPKFKGLFEDDKNENNNENKNNNINEKKNYKFNTTQNFYNNKHNYNQNENNTNNKKNFKDDNDKEKEKQNKFNIENIINNVIENNKRAAAARSSTSFYNIGSNFMNNRMRSTTSKFYNPNNPNRGGGFTGTRDSNFTKDQANEGKFYKPNSLKITLINPLNWRKHEEIWDNLISLNIGLNDLEKYLLPPNETDVLVSSYLKLNPKILNFCSLQKINTSNTKNENNFISFMIDDNIENPKKEMKKWKEAYKRVIFRWHPDKLFSTLDEIKLKNEQQKIEMKKKTTLIINNMNNLYKNIMETLNKILLHKTENNNNA